MREPTCGTSPIGGGALAAIPFLTIGFFSKDAILGEVWVQGQSDLLRLNKPPILKMFCSW
jgi:NADH:ubiquinone oxidoreductase subunit 5 (subunit L)/multisubunit Na+/H+ antiporter MnhA subunit